MKPAEVLTNTYNSLKKLLKVEVFQSDASKLKVTTIQSGTSEVIQSNPAELQATTVPCSWLSSGEKNTDAVIKASGGQLHGIIIKTDGTNDVTAQLYDDPDSASTPITPAIKVAGGDNYGGIMGIDVTCSNGIYLTLSGDNSVAIVYYR